MQIITQWISHYKRGASYDMSCCLFPHHHHHLSVSLLQDIFLLAWSSNSSSSMEGESVYVNKLLYTTALFWLVGSLIFYNSSSESHGGCTIIYFFLNERCKTSVYIQYSSKRVMTMPCSLLASCYEWGLHKIRLVAASVAFGSVVNSVFAGKREEWSVIRQRHVNRSWSNDACVCARAWLQRHWITGANAENEDVLKIETASKCDLNCMGGLWNDTKKQLRVWKV